MTELIRLAYKKVAENQFTYNEGSLNYTLTSGAFHDNDNNGLPDGVQIIGPKPCFGADGTVFDTSKENFHFKVPSGVLIVNSERYQLADLDGDPNNGYELVVPEVQGNIGWTKVDGGFVYKRPADNNPEVMGGLKLFGSDLADNGKGEPAGVTIPTIIIGKNVDGHRLTQIGIEGLHGEVFLNHPIHSFGVKGDDNYNILITKDNGNLVETRFTNISPNSIVNIKDDTAVIETDGNGVYNFTGKGKFKLNNDFITMNGGDRDLKVKVKNGKIEAIDGFMAEDVVKVSKSGNVMINGKKIALAANKNMDMYGKPATASGSDLAISSDMAAESPDTAEVAENTQKVLDDRSNLDYKSSDANANETADFTFSVENLENTDALTFELAQKVIGVDIAEKFDLNAQPNDITIEEISPVEITPETFAENISPAENNFNLANYDALIDEVLAEENPFFIANYELRIENEPAETKTETTLKIGEYLQNLQIAEILPQKNISTDFVLNTESKFNPEIISASQFDKAKFKVQK